MNFAKIVTDPLLYLGESVNKTSVYKEKTKGELREVQKEYNESSNYPNANIRANFALSLEHALFIKSHLIVDVVTVVEAIAKSTVIYI